MFLFNDRYKKEVKEIEAMVRQLRFHNRRFQNHMREFGVCYLKRDAILNNISVIKDFDDSLQFGGDYELLIGKEAEFVKKRDFAEDVKKCIFNKYVALIGFYNDLKIVYDDNDVAKSIFINTIYGLRLPSKASYGRQQYLMSLYDKLEKEFNILNSIVFKEREINHE